MADDTVQISHQAQEAMRSLFQAAQNGVGMQFNVAQRLGEIQQRVVRQAIEAGQEQLQLAGKVLEPRAFADAQAELVTRHGQRYVESVQEAFDVVAQAWRDYSARTEETFRSVTNKAQRAKSSKRT